jgi:hypothetical protein
MRTDWRLDYDRHTPLTARSDQVDTYNFEREGVTFISPGGNAGHDRVHYHLDRIMDDSFSKRVRRRALRPCRPSNILS